MFTKKRHVFRTRRRVPLTLLFLFLSFGSVDRLLTLDTSNGYFRTLWARLCIQNQSLQQRSRVEGTGIVIVEDAQQPKYFSKFDYTALYARLDNSGYHKSNLSGNELAFLPLLRELATGPVSSAVVLGCGTCAVLPHLQTIYLGSAHALEVSPVSVDIARALRRDSGCNAGPCIKVGSLLNIPWHDRSFDVGISCDVLEHIHPDDVPQAISEISRTVEGILVLSIANGPSVRNNTELHLTKKSRYWWTEKFREHGWVPINVHRDVWKSMWQLPTSPRLWNFEGDLCEDTNAVDCGAVFIMLARSNFVSHAEGVLEKLSS